MKVNSGHSKRASFVEVARARGHDSSAVAYVVPLEQVMEAHRVARFFRRLGVPRAAFTCSEEAARWESDYSLLWPRHGRSDSRPSCP